MCESCVPTCSVPLRLSTNGNEVGQVTLLIDSEEAGTVVSVTVGAKELAQAVWTAARDHEARVARQKTAEWVYQMTLGRTVPKFRANRQIATSPSSLPFQMRHHHVELLDTEVPASYDAEVSVMFHNGYTARVPFYDLVPLREDDE